MKTNNNHRHSALLAISLGLGIGIMSGASQAAVVPGDLYYNNTTATALNLDGYFTTDFVYDIEAGDGINLSTTLPHATVNALSAGDDWSFVSFTVPNAGDIGIFDIDGAEYWGIDSFITLLDTDSVTVLDYNDDSDFDGPGDEVSSTWNSFLRYTFDTPGTYYLQIGEYPNAGDGTPSVFNYNNDDLNYKLHVSIGAVPVPAAVWLFGSGLLGLVGVARRKG